MMETFANYGVWLVAVAAAIWGFLMYLKLRSVSNGLLALASKEFHDRVASLLETPQDLPDDVLRYVDLMISTAEANGGSWKVYQAFRSHRLSRETLAASKMVSDTELSNQINQLRPELRELLHGATVMWVNWLINRNVFIGYLIAFELRKIALGGGSVEARPTDIERALTPELAMSC